jgi:hypothetical protein
VLAHVIHTLICCVCLHEQVTGEIKIALEIHGSVIGNQREKGRGLTLFQLKQSDEPNIFGLDEADFSSIRVFARVSITPGSLRISIEFSTFVSVSFSLSLLNARVLSLYFYLSVSLYLFASLSPISSTLSPLLLSPSPPLPRFTKLTS